MKALTVVAIGLLLTACAGTGTPRPTSNEPLVVPEYDTLGIAPAHSIEELRQMGIADPRQQHLEIRRGIGYMAGAFRGAGHTCVNLDDAPYVARAADAAFRHNRKTLSGSEYEEAKKRLKDLGVDYLPVYFVNAKGHQQQVPGVVLGGVALPAGTSWVVPYDIEFALYDFYGNTWHASRGYEGRASGSSSEQAVADFWRQMRLAAAMYVEELTESRARASE